MMFAKRKNRTAVFVCPLERTARATLMKQLNTTIDEVLRDAIQSEVQSREYYLRLADHAADARAKNRLIQLADQQINHRAQLERRYTEMIGQNPPPPQPVTIELPPDLGLLDLPHVLKIALEHERESESNYRFLAERVPNTELGQLFLELAEMEWQHKVDIQSEYNATMDPEQFLIDMG